MATPATRYREDEMKYMNHLLDEVEKTGIKNRFEIRFFDYSTMPFVYQAADFLILPSKTEQMPLAILEAMACEVPVIATRSGGVPELVTHLKTGLLVEYGNVREMSEMIEKSIEDSHLIASITRCAVSLVRRQYSVDRMVADYEKLFKELNKERYEEE